MKLSNQVLQKKKGFKKILDKQFDSQIKNISLRYNGVLEIIENLKNLRNPNLGLTFSTKDTGFKGGLSNDFNLKGNHHLIAEIKQLDLKYPEVKIFLSELIK